MSRRVPIRLLLADRDRVFRRGMVALLQETNDIELVGEAATGDEALQKAREQHPDVVLMDVAMPGVSGMETARRIKGELPETEIIMLSANQDEDQILEAIRAGARSFIVKSDDPEFIVHAVHNVSQGSVFLPPSVARRVMDYIASTPPSWPAKEPALTARQVAVLQLVAQGKTSREIALELSISERTVANHLATIYQRLNVRDRAQAVLYGIRSKIIQL